jgi:hypothetical protein
MPMKVPPRPEGAADLARQLRVVIEEILDRRLAQVRGVSELVEAERVAQQAALMAIRMDRLGPSYDNGYLVMVTELARELNKTRTRSNPKSRRGRQDQTPRLVPLTRKR